MVLPLLPLLLLAQTPAKDEKPLPKADRSGEAVLRQIMDSMSKVAPVKLTISASSRSAAKDVLQPEETVTLWYQSPDRFSVTTSGVWGDSARYVSDGKTFLHDPFDDYQVITVKDSGPNLLETEAELSRRIDPLGHLLQGPKLLDKAVRQNGYIKEIDPAGPERGVQYESAKKGIVTLFYNEKDSRKLVTRVEYDNLPYYLEQHKLYPEWWDMPDQPLTVWMIEYLSIGKVMPKSVLTVHVPPGKNLVDSRKKPAKKPPLVSSRLAGP